MSLILPRYNLYIRLIFVEVPVFFGQDTELIADPEFQAIIKYAFKDIPFEYVAQQMRNAKSNLEYIVTEK